MKKGKLITRKKVAGATALLLSAIMLVGGAFAWQYYGDHKTNEGESDGLKYKARLVEKFDPNETKEWNVTDPPVTKELRVSNPGKEVATDKSVYGDIFVRLQLKEFMEFYPLTYVYTDVRYMTRPDGTETIVGESAAVEKKSGGFYAFDTQADAQAFADQIDLEYGNGPHVVKDVTMYGDTQARWFVQTKESDPNGVYGSFILTDVSVDKTTPKNIIESDAGVTIPAKASDDQMSEADGGLHNEYNIGEQGTAPNGECLYTVHTWENGLHGFDVNANSAVNPNATFGDYVELIFGNDVVLMSNWNGEAVNKWIVDDSIDPITGTNSGWVYWGNPLAPQEETSNLLEQIQLIRQPNDAFYYAIHADMEAVSYDQISDFNAPQEVVDAWTNASKKTLEVTANPVVGLGSNNFKFESDETNVKWELVGNINGVTIDPVTGVITVDGSVPSLGEPLVPIGTKITARATTADGKKTGTATTEVALPITADYFPDADFRNYIATQDQVGNVFDTNGDGLLTKAELEMIVDVKVYGNSDTDKGNITNIKGIEYLTGLEFLDCGMNQLIALDVSKNTALKDLRCGINQLTSIDVSKNTQLTYLHCAKNQLTALDVSNNTSLTTLYCYENQLTELDVTKNIELEALYCYNNKLTSLDVSKNTALQILNCNINQLTSLDVSKNTALTDLGCSVNQLTTLDVSQNTALITFGCEINQLTSLDVSKNTALQILNCNSNQLTSLDVSKNIALTNLGCSVNKLTVLDVSKNTALTSLGCEGNHIISINTGGRQASITTFRYINQTDKSNGNVIVPTVT